MQSERITPLTSAEYRSLKGRAAASRALRMARVRRIAREAGIDPGIPFLHANNALCGLAYGQPWAGVNYSKVRLVRRLEGELFAADHIVDRLAQRRRVAVGS